MGQWNVVCDFCKKQVLTDCHRIDDERADILREHLVNEHHAPLPVSSGLGKIIQRYTFLSEQA